MQASALIVSSDSGFAETMKSRLQDWNMTVALSGDLPPHLLCATAVEIVLLDIRQNNSEMLDLLRAIREKMPATEVILINRPDNIPLSIAGMQAGAAAELIAPFDTSTLKNTIAAALRRRKKQQGRKSIFQRFGEAMVAATFAQAGEFDTAIDMLDDKKNATHDTDQEKT